VSPRADGGAAVRVWRTPSFQNRARTHLVKGDHKEPMDAVVVESGAQTSDGLGSPMPQTAPSDGESADLGCSPAFSHGTFEGGRSAKKRAQGEVVRGF